MGELAKLFSFERRNLPVAAAIGAALETIETRSSFNKLPESTLLKPTEWFMKSVMGGLGESLSGENVSIETALSIPAVQQATNIRARMKSLVPLKLFQTKGERSDELTNDYRSRMVGQQWNPQTCAALAVKTVSYNQDLYGAAYVFIDWIGGNKFKQLIPIPSNRVKMSIDEAGQRRYKVTNRAGKVSDIPAASMMPLPSGLTIDGLTSESAIEMCANAIGTMLAANRQQARFFKNSAKFMGAFSAPSTLSDPAYARLKEDVQEKYTGVDNTGKPLFLEEGLTFQKMSMTAEELGLPEYWLYIILEVARIFNIPPIFLFEYGRATWGNMQEMMIQAVLTSLLPEFVLTEQIYNQCLLTEQEREQGYYFKHMIRGLLRGNLAAQATFYKEMRQIGVFNADEIRAFEEMNPLPDGQGKIYLAQSNNADLNSLDEESQLEKQKMALDAQKVAAEAAANNKEDEEEEPKKKKEKPKEQEKRSETDAWMLVFMDKFAVAQRREEKFSEKNATRSEADQASERTKFYESHRSYLVESLDPMVTAACVAFEVPEHKRAAMKGEIEAWIGGLTKRWGEIGHFDESKRGKHPLGDNEVVSLATAVLDCIKGDDHE